MRMLRLAIKTNNDINSAGLSVYADITASNSYVYRDDSADTEAIKYFSDLNKTAVSGRIFLRL